MKRTGTGGIRRKGVGPITLGRASRLHHLVSLLSQGIAERDILLKRLEMGIRTFYRELEMLKRCGVKVRRDGKTYGLKTSLKEAEGLLPFPDPQLSFAEVADLSKLTGAVAGRLAELYGALTTHAAPTTKRKKK
jgi:hypothetical protein